MFENDWACLPATVVVGDPHKASFILVTSQKNPAGTLRAVNLFMAKTDPKMYRKYHTD